MNHAIGIDLGGSSAKAVSVSTDGALIEQATVGFDPAVPMQWAERIRILVEEFQARRGTPALAVGLSAPGLPRDNGRSIACLPERLQGLEGFEWGPHLGTSRPVPVLNDAHAALLGEAWVGAARGLKNVIMLTLGTGVGGAALVDGRLLRGEIGRAGHFGHSCLDPCGPPDICGTPASLEMAVGNCSIEQRSGGRFKTTHELVAAHLAGDAEASKVWFKSLRALACAIASFINILDPAAVIIGGGIARCGSALFGPLQTLLDEVEWRPAGQRVFVIPAALGEYAGAYGAAWKGLQPN